MKLALLFGAALMVLPQEAPQKDRFDRALRIGVVNLAECFDKMKSDRWAGEVRKIEAAKADWEAKLVDSAKKIKELGEALKTINDKRGELFIRKAGEYEQATGAYEATKKGGEMMLGMRSLAFHANYFEQYVQGAIDAVRTKLKLDFILRLEEPKLENETAESVMRRISQRVILSHDPNLDVTKNVLEKLNEDFKKKP